MIYAQFFPRGADTNGYARFVFNSFDIQRKQEITFTDFVIGLSVLTRGTIDEQLRWIFTLYDINGDGIITKDELSRIVSSVHDLMGKFAAPNATSGQSSNEARSSAASGPGWPMNSKAADPTNSATNSPALSNEEQAEQLFRKFDLNNDGIITLDEFLEACHSVSRVDFLPKRTQSSRSQLTFPSNLIR